jgi:7,8-dihydropterin-6-yl-methyl-4-(beta-D-ribofuranosyl)aminobenzene 5'-phosphate synthase
MEARYLVGRRQVAHWQGSGVNVEPLDVGTVRSLSVLPLVEWYTCDPGLATEPGVSYLVRADETTILFDLGLGRRVRGTPSLVHNMARLGVEVESIDLVVLSHPHGDHAGGFANQFLRRLQLDGVLAHPPVYTTVPMTVPGGPPVVVDGPRVLACGVGTTGSLPVQLFVFGTTLEQALVVRVADRGLVLIVGCGHPGIAALVEQAERAFGGPVYGVIGGLHLPITGDRVGLPGINLQRLLGSAEQPWVPLRRADVDKMIAFLRARQVQLVAPSAHDACDWSLAQLACAFGEACRPLRVGEEVVIHADVAAARG